MTEQHARSCTCGHLTIEAEKRSGLHSTIMLSCWCGTSYSCSTIDCETENINKNAIWGTISSGSTFTHTKELLCVMDIPPLSGTLFCELQDQLSKVWMHASIKDMEAAGAEERKIALQNHNVDADGVPWICVYLDGGWSKRSYGSNFDAASGGVIIGRATKKVLYLGKTTKKIKQLEKIAQKAIFDNAHGDISSLIEDLGNGPNHVFSDHSKCKNYHCGEMMGETVTEFNQIRASGLFRLVQVSLVVRKADSLIDNETNNRAELFMSVLTRFNAGKRLNLIQKNSFQTRSLEFVVFKFRRLYTIDHNSGYRFLIDSGADVSVTPPSSDKTHPSSDKTLFAANGTPIVTFGEKLLQLDIGLRRNFSWVFIVAQVQQPILGADFCHILTCY
ncbi:hypothetical protein RI129_003295 [Pyrocoelia pectoralis]|uniref:Mutator-like transposase domain-containing protein n=1 Tax=Pyrocoelia pectoralis TaxID=417401 RepID=A0AAN7VR30_9COLE